VGGALLIAAVLWVVPTCSAHPARQGHVSSGLVGDVDGDGRPDRVVVRVVYSAPPHCALHLVVVPGRGRPLVAPLRPPALDRDGVRTAGWPRVVWLATIDGRPGAEIAFTDHLGASTAFLGVFTVRRHALVRMRVPRQDDVFPISPGTYFGGADCVGGLVVSTTGELERSRVIVDRRFFRVVGTAFRLVRARHYRLRALGHRFPELAYGEPAFSRC